MNNKNTPLNSALYEKDDGPLTSEQISLIRKESTATQTSHILFTPLLWEYLLMPETQNK